jgi:uncharacterized protein (DUF885 family)
MHGLKAFLLLLAIGMVVTSITLVAHAQLPAGAGTPVPTMFQSAVSQFIEAELKLYPERATALGDHRFDERFDDHSTAGIARILSHAHRWIKIFRAFDASSLSADEEADRQWLLANIDRELLWTERVGSYQRDPGIYLPTAAIEGLIKRNFAPARVRMHSVTAREVAALANLRAARANLKPQRVPQVATDIVLKDMGAILKFFKSTVPSAFDKVPDGPDKKAFREANAHVISAIDDYGKWLQEDLRPHARGSYRRRCLSQNDS